MSERGATTGEERPVRRQSARSGQAAVEFVISSLLFFTVIFGMIDMGRLVFLRVMFTNAVREGARQAAITPGSAAAIADAAALRSPTLNLSASNFTVTCSDWSGNARSCTTGSTNPKTVKQLERVRVCGTYTFTAVYPRLVGRSTISTTECEYTSVR